jgi:hypothetical protein
VLASGPEVVEAVRWWADNYDLDAVTVRDVHQLLPGRYGLRHALDRAVADGLLREVQLPHETGWMPK